MPNNEYLIISSIFGKKFKKVYDAPCEKSFFFSNNINLKTIVEKKGWIFFYINFPLSDDIIISSLQSKYIKFLIFLKDYRDFDNYEKIIYFDHKFKVDNKWIDNIKNISKKNNTFSIIIRKTPREKNNISEEINEAINQKRYLKNIEKTKKYIQSIKNTFNERVRICNTGLIIYNNYKDVYALMENIYEKCIEHSQPECQIYWAILSQKYEKKILKINWNELNPIWKPP